ncbi:MAG: AgmX/PglI C-terminal domain-containing protein [Myxococcales bacterium]|nr:AgmX/PglI C-terminal domain-containing protein [Myxococcales bacterium]
MKFRCDKCNAQYAIADEKVGKKGVRVKCKKCANVITVRPAQEQAAAGAEEAPAAVSGAPAPGPTEGADVPTEANQRESTDVSAPPAPTDGGGPKIGDEDLGNAFDNILGESGLPDDGAASGGNEDLGEGDLDRQSTRLFSVEEMQKVQAEKEKATRREEESRQIGDLYRLARGEEPGTAPASPGDSSPGVPASGEDRLEWYLAVDDQQMGPLSLRDVTERFHRGEIRPDTLAWKSGLGDWAPLLEVAELRFLVQSSASTAADVEEPAAPAERAFSQEEDEEPAGAAPDGASMESEEAHSGEQEYSDTSVTGAAFAADVDWKPSAVSALSSLAEEELASLKPPEPEPLPEPSDVIPPLTDEKAAPDTAPMDDGDSSIIGQIRAEEEAAAREAERKRQEEERLAAEAAAARRKQEEEALAAQEAARREQYQEKKERVVPPPEVSAAPHAAVPRWLIGVLAGGGLLILVLLGFIAYILVRGQVPPEPGQGVPLGPPAAIGTAPAAPPATAGGVTPPAPPSPPDSEGPASPPAPAAGAESASPAAGVAAAPPPAPPSPEEKPATPGKKVAPPREPKKVVQPPKPPQEKDETLARLQREEKTDRGRKEREAPPPEEAKPKKKIDKNDILNFRDDDEDDKALQKEMGVKRAEAAPAPKPEEKKELPPRTNADVLEVMKQHLAEFQACSRKQKEVDASVQGRMVIKFVITPEGTVTKLATDTAEFKGTFVSDCIGRVINGIRFPKAGGGPMTVPFPFTVK